MKRWRIVVAVGLFVALCPSVGAPAATRTVTIPGRSYSPERVSIVLGDTVRWVNSSNERHSVSANSDARARGETFDSNPGCGRGFLLQRCMRPGETYAHTFSVRGTFTYYCRRHGSDAAYPNCGMCAQVTVVRPATSTITPTPPGSASPSAPSPSPSVSPSPSPGSTTSGGSPRASGPDADDGAFPTLAIAALGVAILSGSGFLVYRTMIRR